MATIAERMRQGMEMRGLKQVDLIKITGIGKSSISTYLTGTYRPSQKNIYKIAKALDVSEAWLLGYDVPMERKDDKIPLNLKPVDPSSEIVQIPIIGRVAAGMNCLAEENIVGYEPMFADDMKGGGDYTFLKIEGNSMYPEMKDGDLVLVRLQKSVDSGSYAVVLIDGEEGVVKKVVYDDDWIELQSINPMYEPRRFEGADVTRVEIYGLVKDLKRKFN